MTPQNLILVFLLSLSRLPVQGAIFSNFTSNPEPLYREELSTGSTFQSLAWQFQASQDAGLHQTVHLKLGAYNLNGPSQPVSLALQFYADGSVPADLLASQTVDLDADQVLDLDFSGLQFQTGQYYWFVISAVGGSGTAAVQLFDANPPLDLISTDNAFHYGDPQFPTAWSAPINGYATPNLEITVVPEPVRFTFYSGLISMGAAIVYRARRYILPHRKALTNKAQPVLRAGR